jgi:hypothetical protein
VEVKALRRVFVEREPAPPLEEEGVEESQGE